MKKILIYFSLLFLLFAGCKQATSDTKDRTDESNNRSEERDKDKKEKEKEKRTDALIEPKWGAHFYKAHDGKTEAIEHIWLRHNYNSTYSNVSRFAKSYSTRQAIKNLIIEACEKAKPRDIQDEAGGQKTVTVTMDKPTGLSQKGKPTNQIRIHLDKKDFVKTAYPK